MSDIVLCCGKVCSGKSTFTRKLEAEFGFYPFSADEWMLKLYEETADRAVFNDRLSRCVGLIHDLSAKLLDRGNSVALDFGFWSRADRRAVIERYEARGHRVTLVYFPIAINEQLAFMRKRQETEGGLHYRFDEKTVITLNGFFEEPAGDEQAMSPAECLATLERSRQGSIGSRGR
ncbi:MAG TPA: ATP-binding protein [Treponemataceae bacterium]|nr:ATP-binding protein [Treponemataceae bacterium]